MQVGGRRIGSVREIKLTDDNQAEITISVQDELRAAARGHDGAHPGDLAVGHRQPLHRADAGPELQPQARRRGHARDRQDDVDRRPRPALQHARPQDAHGLQQVIQGIAQLVRRHAATQANAATKYFNPALSDLAPAGQRARLRPADAQRLPASTPPGRRRRSPRAATTSPNLVSNANTTAGRDRRRERVVQPGAGAAAQHAAQGQHDVRQPARDARRPRRARGRVQAGDEGPRAVPAPAAPARAATRARRSPTCARSSTARARTTTSSTCCGKAPRARAGRQAGLRELDRGAAEGHAGASSSSGPTRPTSSAGCATSARARPTTTPTATSRASRRSSTPTRSTDNPAGGTLTPLPPSQRLAGLQTGQVQRCPGAATPGRRPDGSAPFRDPTAPWTATPASCPPAHEAPPRHRRRARRRRGAAGLRHRRERRQRRLPRARDLRERLLGHPGRGREDRRASRSARSSRSTSRPTTRPPSCCASTDPGFQDFRQDADLHDPPAVADRREVRRVHAHPAAARERPAGAETAQDRARGRQGPVPAAGHADVASRSTSTSSTTRCACPTASACRIIINELGTGLAGRGGDLRLAIRQRQPGAQGDRQGPRDPRRPEPHAGQPGPQQRHDPRPAGPRPGAGGQLRHAGQDHGQATAERCERSGADHRQAAGLPARADARRCRAWARFADQATPVLHRPRHGGALRSTASSRSSGRSPGRDPGLPVAGRRRRRRRPCADQEQADHHGPRSARRERQAADQQPRVAARPR